MRHGWMRGAAIAALAVGLGGCEARKPGPDRVPKPRTEERSNDQGHALSGGPPQEPGRVLGGPANPDQAKPSQGTGGGGSQGR